MMDPRTVRKEMLVGLADLRAPHTELDFSMARRLAEDHARQALSEPMLLAWFNRPTWTHSPAIC